MKPLLLTLIGLFTFLLSCDKKQKEVDQKVTLSFTVDSPFSDSIVLKDNNFLKVKSFLLDSNNRLVERLELERGYYAFKHGDEYAYLYLDPNDSLSISFDASRFDSSLTYQGHGASKNRYILEKTIKDNELNSLVIQQYNEDRFLKLADSIQEIQSQLLEKYKNKLDSQFLYLAKNKIKYQTLYKKLTFEGLHRFYTKNNAFEVSDTYPELLEEIEFENEKLASLSSYKSSIRRYIIKKTNEARKEGDSLEFYNLFLKILDENIKSPLIKSELAFYHANVRITSSNSPDDFMNRYRKLSRNEKQKALIEKKYKNIKLTQKGMPSPLFTFENKNGKKVSLEEFKGKVVYVDIWATWCAPCIREIPHLKELQENYKNQDIAFISIAYEDKKEVWKKKIMEKELGGIHLFSYSSNHPFFTKYSVNGIPRFILLDQELNIVDPNADRPSTESLKIQLDELLKLS